MPQPMTEERFAGQAGVGPLMRFLRRLRVKSAFFPKSLTEQVVDSFLERRLSIRRRPRESGAALAMFVRICGSIGDPLSSTNGSGGGRGPRLILSFRITSAVPT